MKQLELDFNSINLSDHYEAYRVIDEGKNQICSWSDSLSDDGKKISCTESNRGPIDYKSIALPAELQGHNRFLLRNLN